MTPVMQSPNFHGSRHKLSDMQVKVVTERNKDDVNIKKQSQWVTEILAVLATRLNR